MVTEEQTSEKKIKEILTYSPENKKVFEELSALCIDKKIVPYVGSGLSKFAGFPTWDEFINPLYKKCFYKERPVAMDFIVAADLIEQKLTKEKFYKLVHDSMGGNTTETEWTKILNDAKEQAVSVIPELFRCPILTTNFDQIIEHIHEDIHDFEVAFPNDLDKIEKAKNERKRILYKIHGCVSDVENIVFTKNKYKTVYQHDSHLVKSLSELFQGFHFLFLGCGLDIIGGTKDYTTDLWEQLNKKGSRMYHYAILPCKVSELKTRREELERINIRPILFESGKFESIKIILDAWRVENEKRLFQIPLYDSKYMKYVEREDSVIDKIKNKLNDKKFFCMCHYRFWRNG